jgi:hypothetical protein
MADLFPGVGQQTLATQLAISRASGARGGKRSARKRRKTAGTKKKVSTRGRRSTAIARGGKRSRRKVQRLVKGSPAARRHMAKLRRMRKRRK